MKRGWMVVATLCAVLAVSAASAQTPPAKTSAAEKLKVKRVTFGIGHRVYADFYDEVSARMNEEFRIGDTKYTARAGEFLPDFSMDMNTHKVFSRSNETNNPAFHVFVKKAGAPEDTVWAFLNMPPHFGRRSMLAFQILKVEFENHAPLVAKADTTRTAPAAKQP
jgi:hypothetical protein